MRPVVMSHGLSLTHVGQAKGGGGVLSLGSGERKAVAA